MKKLLRALQLILLVLLMLMSDRVSAQYNEKYRDQYHFSPNSGWIGDPDGLFKWKGMYHMYWWGHASSTDFVHWTHQAYPIIGSSGGYGVNTGSAVVDKNNVAGFGANAVIGFHTFSNGGNQGVGISSSTDSGFNFYLYSGNPILPIVSTDDFRDPQVFWHAPSNRWVMAISRGHQRKISFYTSTNLKTWTLASDFGPSGGYSYDNWETPDLFPLAVDDNPDSIKRVLTVAAFPTAGGGGDTVRQTYHIGQFDGTTFTSDNPGTEFRFDYGNDFYAARTWRDYDSADQKRRTILGWMGSWAYAQIAPSQQTYKGKGIVSLPRDLLLRTYPEGVRLAQVPIHELQSLRKAQTTLTNKSITGTNNISTYGSFVPTKNVYEFDATFTVNTSATFGFNLCVDNAADRRMIVKYDGSSSILTIDRSKSSDNSMNALFALPVSAVIPPVAGKLNLHVFVDQASVEVFVNHGKTAFSMLTFAGMPQAGLEVFSSGGTTTLDTLNGWMLDSIWDPSKGYRIDDHGIYEIVNRDNNKVMDAPSEDPNNGAQIQQWDNLGGNNQKWQVDSLTLINGLTYYKLTNIAMNKVVDLDGGSSANGAKIQEWSWLDNVNQRWRMDDLGAGYFRIVNYNEKGLEVEGGNDSNGHKFQQWEFLGYPHQEFTFFKVGSAGSSLAAPPVSEKLTIAPEAFTVYPNPVQGASTFTVSLKPNAATNGGARRLIQGVMVVSVSGEKIKEFLGLNKLSSYEISTSGMSSQIYYVNVFDGKGWESHAVNVIQ